MKSRMIDQASAPLHQAWQDCRLTGVRADGALVVSADGIEREVELAGIRLSQPIPSSYFEFLSRFSALPQPMHCDVVGHTASGRALATVHYFAWQDKSGDVWLDLATTLVEQRLAQPAERSRQTP
jgi:hypothetical protein